MVRQQEGHVMFKKPPKIWTVFMSQKARLVKVKPKLLMIVLL